MLSGALPYQHGYFTLKVRIKETQELDNPISRKLKIHPKGFILGVETKVCHSAYMTPFWYQIFLVLAQQNTL
jgi:hypothetical protein